MREKNRYQIVNWTLKRMSGSYVQPDGAICVNFLSNLWYASDKGNLTHCKSEREGKKHKKKKKEYIDEHKSQK